MARKAVKDVKERYIRISIEQYNAISRLGINVRRLINAAMQNVLSDSFRSLTFDLRIEFLETQKSEIREDIAELKLKIQAKQIEINTLSKQQDTIRAEAEIDAEPVRYSYLLSQLNPVIVYNDYKSEMVEHVASKLLQDICKIKPDFDLKKHMALLKRVNKN